MNDVREFIRAVFSKIILKAQPYVVKRKLDASQFYAYYGFVLYSTILQLPIHNVRVRSIRPCSFPLKWRYGLTNFPIGTPRPQTNVSASLHCFVLDSASWDIAPVSRLNMCVLWKSWIAINRNERRNVNARSRNRYFQVKKCSSHLKPRRINAHKSF